MPIIGPAAKSSWVDLRCSLGGARLFRKGSRAKSQIVIAITELRFRENECAQSSDIGTCAEMHGAGCLAEGDDATMAKVYGTNGPDFLGWRGLFDRDGVTDGDDWIFGLGGDDWIKGHDGNDFLFGGEGADLLDGGDDIDTAIYSDSPYGVTVDLQTGKGHGGTAEGDQLYSIENLIGSWWGDHLIGNANDNVLSGLGGNDDLEGGAGADTLDGGWGVDRAIYSNSPAGVMVSLLWGSASGGDAEGDKLISIESLYGSEYDDGLFGDNGANSLQGYARRRHALGLRRCTTSWRAATATTR